MDFKILAFVVQYLIKGVIVCKIRDIYNKQSEFQLIHNCAIEKQWIAIFNSNPKNEYEKMSYTDNRKTLTEQAKKTNQTESYTSGPLNTEGSFISFQVYNDGVEPT